MRNRGALALARTGKTATQIGVDLGVSAQTVSRWLKGEKKPSPERRALIAQLYKVPSAWWDEAGAAASRRPKKGDDAEAGSAPPSGNPPPGEPPTAAVVGGSFGMAYELEQYARQEIEKLRQDPESSPLERARVMAAIAGALNVLARITGEYDLWRKLTRTAVWRRVEHELKEGLKTCTCGKAAPAIAERFSRLDDEAQRAG
jgi:transcriptional regulator with XRE-family HTH domain